MKNVILYDGPKGSQFLSRGLTGCPDLYNITEYEKAKDVIRTYAEAGSEWIQTNTFNSNGLSLAGRGKEELQEQIISQAIKAAKEVALETKEKTGREPKIIFSTGPTGKMIEPYGDVPEEEAYESYKKQIETAVGCGIYNVHLETFMDLNEMEIAIRAASDVREKLKAEGINFEIYTTMAFEAHGKTMFGNSPEDCFEVFKKYDVDAFGGNCACTAAEMKKVIEAFSRVAGKDAPIIAKPNAGKPITEGDKVTYAETPEMYASACLELIEAGAKIVGGCCGTSEKHIAALNKLLLQS